MKPRLEKTAPDSELVWRYNLLEMLVCPAHPANWSQDCTEDGKYPDTTEWCDCCIGDCTPFCKSCDNWDEDE